MSERCVIHGDCLEALAGLPACSIDAVVTDPPYGIGFMGHEWDQPGDHAPLKKNGTPGPPNIHHGTGRRFRASQPDPSGYELEGGGAMVAGRYDLSHAANRRFQAWVQSWSEECFRVLKPGGYLIAFGGTRTYHRLASGVEDAGFEVRDCLQWLFGSGFPKSLDVGKAIDKLGGDPELLDEMAGVLRGARETRKLSLADADRLFCDGSSAWPWYEGRVWYGERRVVPPSEERAASIAEAWPETGEVFARMRQQGVFVGMRTHARGGNGDFGKVVGAEALPREVEEYALATAEAAEWDGWGTALKPAFEPIVMARKPLAAGTVAANVLRYGTGAINVDACRIAGPDENPSIARRNGAINHLSDRPAAETEAEGRMASRQSEEAYRAARSGEQLGRWPGNVLLSHHEDCVEVGTWRVKAITGTGNHDGSVYGARSNQGEPVRDYADEEGMETVEAWDCVEGCPVRMLDEQTGTLVSGKPGTHRLGENTGAAFGAESRTPGTPMSGYGDAGGASRFFYCAKTSRAERNAGLGEDFDAKLLQWSSGTQNPGSFQSDGTDKTAKNHHPTVKPIMVMRWLIRLVVRPGGVLVDPFAGSGSTLCAAALEDVNAIGIEREADYVPIMAARVRFWEEHGEDGLRIVRERDAAVARRVKAVEQGQLELL